MPQAISVDVDPGDETREKQTASQARKSADPGLNILLLGSRSEAADAVALLVEQAFGERCTLTQIRDPQQGAAAIREGTHDIYLFAEDEGSGDAEAFVRASLDGGCEHPIIVLSENDSTATDLRAVDAGAADCIPLSELTASGLERSIRHALLREHGVKRTRREIDHLAAEISRLNTLRDANHRFVDNACHDFRSPLTVIKEFSSIISEGLAGDVNEEQAEFLEIILSRVDQLSHMVDAILDASRLESDVISVQREEHAPAELLEHTRPTLEQLAASSNAQIRFSVPDTLPNVFADMDSVGRIVVNLVTNACKFVGDNGEIDVWGRYDADGGTVTVGVTDNGPGIAPEHVKLIFERFKQIESENEVEKAGFGLGLHIATELARVNFGTLSVESTPNKGSTFAFTLPVFDVDRLIPLHFGFLKTSRHVFQNVSIAVVTSNENGEEGELSEVERFLNRQLRSYDLLLRLKRNSWLACLACDEDDLSGISGRIQTSYMEHNRNRPNGALPEIDFRSIGTWTLSNPTPELSEAILSAYALGTQPVGIH